VFLLSQQLDRLAGVDLPPPLTPARLLTSWTFDPAVCVALVLVGGGYLIAVRRLAGRGDPWPAYRTAAFLILGLGSVALATMSGLAVYGRVLFWPAAVQNTLLGVLTPVFLALGDPVGLVLKASPRLGKLLRGRAMRFLTYPFVSSLLAIGSQLLVYFTGYFPATLDHPAVRELMHLQFVLTGVLFTIPLLGEDFLPAWCTYPVRTAIAFLDGLLDALPGLVVMTSSHLIAADYYRGLSLKWGPSLRWDQTIGGAGILVLSELIAVIFLAVMFRAWIRADALEAAEVDQELDRIEGGLAAAPGNPEQVEAELMRPWWESDPGPLAERARLHGWRRT